MSLRPPFIQRQISSTASMAMSGIPQEVNSTLIIVVMASIGVLIGIQSHTLPLVQFYGGMSLYILLMVGQLWGVWLARKNSPLVLWWTISVLVPIMVAIILILGEHSEPMWLAFPLSSVSSTLFFSPRVARWHVACLAVTFIVSVTIGTHGTHLIESFSLLIFTLLLPYFVDTTRRRESQMLETIAAQSAGADALSSISWLLTTLSPTTKDFLAILEEACPDDASLALMLLDDDTLVTTAAVGEDAAALWEWRYQVQPESLSMVAIALRDRRTLTASVQDEGIALLLGGALPDTHLPMRSVVVLPIMRKGMAPLGVLLAISDSADVLAAQERLGILPIVASQLAIALENAHLFQEAQSRADHDVLTGLYHHRAMHQRLGEEIVRADRSAVPFAMLMIDLDRFKLFNETYGHQVGDRIIAHTSTVLRRMLRSSDILGRYGGDEFLAILPDTDPAEARQVANDLLDAISKEAFKPGDDTEQMPLTLSIGLVTYPRDGRTVLELIGNAEHVMLEAKHAGGHRCEVTEVVDEQGAGGRSVDLRGFGILESLVTAVDHKDRYTKDHSEEVATYAQILAEEIHLPASRIALLFDAGLLHDVGKVGVPDAILRKPGRLTTEEFAAMQQHVVLSEALLRCLLPADTDPDLLDAVRYHHERWDGQGYPRRLAGEDVPLIGRIMIVADAVSAMHMDRPYRKGLSPVQIVNELRRGAGSQFDPALVEPFITAFLRHLDLRESDLPDVAPAPVHSQSVLAADAVPVTRINAA